MQGPHRDSYWPQLGSHWPVNIFSKIYEYFFVLKDANIFTGGDGIFTLLGTSGRGRGGAWRGRRRGRLVYGEALATDVDVRVARGVAVAGQSGVLQTVR